MVVEIYRRSLPEQASEHSARGRYLDVEELLARRHNIAGYEFQALVGSSRGLRGVLNQIEIVAGIKSNDQVIINPPDSIVSGQKVQIVQGTLPGDAT